MQDMSKLKTKLKNAKLVMGPIEETVQRFFEEYNPSPIGAVFNDLDYYSSTTAALTMFDAPEKYFLPRVYCYFDDIVGGGGYKLSNEFMGERLAINEFNQSHENKKIAFNYNLLAQRIVEPWHHKIFIYHDFQHSKYNHLLEDRSRATDCSLKDS